MNDRFLENLSLVTSAAAKEDVFERTVKKPERSLVLLVHHGHAAFPTLRRVPRADRIIARLGAGTAADACQHDAQQEQQQGLEGAALHVRKPDGQE